MLPKQLPEGLSGKIKLLREQGSDGTETVSRYDRNGRLISREVLEHGKATEHEHFAYDSFGNEIEYGYYEHMPGFLGSEDGGLTQTKERQGEYNEQNLLVYEFDGETSSERDTGHGSRYAYEHDAAGRLLKKVTMTLDYEIRHIEEYTYHDNGKLRSETYQDGPADGCFFGYEFEYDEDGLKLKSHYHNIEREDEPAEDVTIVLSGKEFY